ncbi:FAD:protein FMN transferase [Bacillus sp. REN10]|uniref:FAD:protein FMN transferase n=1 Tax=Bacillus sp. REN10 TaxID=2782541 RepID=UPI00193C28CC|nr:FAD:protein FMN transferase [Bacillus sp. REN10]
MDDEFYSFQAMNTEVKVIGGFPQQERDIAELKRWFQEVEQTCSRFLPFNELDRFNQMAPGTAVQVSSMLFEILKQAVHYSEATNGFFNPLIANNMAAIGYDRSFEQIGKIEESFDLFIEESEDHPFEFAEDGCTILKQTEQAVDLGGFAKGWAVDQGAKWMRQRGVSDGQLNAGGDVTVWGEKEKLIGIAHPEKETLDIAQFYMYEGSVATSNKVFRSWKQGSVQRHHLLNGQTGLPAISDVIQATVFASTTVEAEVMAKVLCIFTFDEGLSWLRAHFPHAAALVVDENGRVRVSRTIKNYTKKLML